MSTHEENSNEQIDIANGIIENQPAASEMENMYLNFYLDEETFGIEICHVIQIVGLQKITKMPDMPQYMLGYIELRGDVISVASLRTRFGKSEIEYTDRTCIIIINDGTRDVGIVVDAIKETLTIEPGQISPPPTSTYAPTPYMIGVARLGEGETSILIDVTKLNI